MCPLPMLSSKALTAVEVLATGVGAKTAAEPVRVAMMADFMMEWRWAGRSAAAEGCGDVVVRDGMNESAWPDRQPPASVLTRT